VHDLDPESDALVVTSDHGHRDRGGHGGVEPEVVQIPVVFWGAGVPPRPGRDGASGRDVGPTIVHLLGLPPLRHATGQSLIGTDTGAEHQRAAVRMALEHRSDIGFSLGVVAAAALVVILIAVNRMPNAGLRAWLTSPAYLLAYGASLAGTHTLTFSATNDAATFAGRLVALGVVGGLAQIGMGGCASLVPATLVTALAVGIPMTTIPTRLLDLRSATLSFLPIPGLVGAGVICFFAAGFTPGRRRVRDRVPRVVDETPLAAKEQPLP
jgi:multisubunit Na+/H+ antiporter MnhB subunit